MKTPNASGMKIRQIIPVIEPQARLVGGDVGLPDPVQSAIEDVSGSLELDRAVDFQASIDLLSSFIEANGNICDLLTSSEISNIGSDAVREWRDDAGSIQDWRDMASKGLCLATQDFSDDEEKNYPWDDASNIHYPILTQAAQQWSARAYPELVKGDKVVGVKVFNHPAIRPSPGEIANSSPPPQNPMDAQASQQAMAQDQQQEAIMTLQAIAKNTRGLRVAHYMNWCVFYKMDNWESDTDLLLSQLPITGSGFKKVYMTPRGVKSEYVSPLNITVHADTTSMIDCPRITHDFMLYPYQIKQNIYSGLYNDVDLGLEADMESQETRHIIEQHRMIDLDDDGLPEPYIVTVDVETQQTLRIEPAFGMDDIYVDDVEMRITRIERWQPFPDFKFLPNPKGGFYATGFAQLLDSITDSIDTSINQLMDAGSAEIAGGGFIGSGVRLQGSGQGGSMWFRPGEYQMVSTPGGALREAIFERTVPHPSAVTLSMLQMLMESAKDIASIKDVITGEGNAQAPVGTTLALQNQALQVFSSIYKRVYQGFRSEFRMMYQCLKKFGTDQERKEYFEITGGNFDEDFDGDGTDIQPVADPNVVTKLQKISRMQTLMQIAESPLGQAAGMTQPKSAQALILEVLDTLDIDRPERFIMDIPPNPAQQEADAAKTAEVAATAKLKEAQAVQKRAEAVKNNAQTIREVGLASVTGHQLRNHSAELLSGAVLNPAADQSGSVAGPSTSTSITPQQ
jgi:chaperonin GroES